MLCNGSSLILRYDLLLNGYGSYVLHFLNMSQGSSTFTHIPHSSYGCHILEDSGEIAFAHLRFSGDDLQIQIFGQISIDEADSTA